LDEETRKELNTIRTALLQMNEVSESENALQMTRFARLTGESMALQVLVEAFIQTHRDPVKAIGAIERARERLLGKALPKDIPEGAIEILHREIDEALQILRSRAAEH
jgi:hypothetical protein